MATPSPSSHTPPTYFESLDSPSALPQYSPTAAETEQSVALARNNGSSPTEYVRTSAHIILNLGPKIWKTNVPCYGHNGIVEGYVDLCKLERVSKVDIKVSHAD